MAKTVRVENHYYPEGELFNLPSLGQVENFGEPREVTEDQLYNYRAMGFEWPSDGDDLVIVIKEPDPIEELVDSSKKDLLNEAKSVGATVNTKMTKDEIAQAILDKRNETALPTAVVETEGAE